MFGRRDLAIGLAGVALCHDILVAPALMRTPRRLGLASLTAMLAAHVGLAFEIVFAGHARQCARAALVRMARPFSAVNEFIGSPRVAVHDDPRASPHGIDGRGLA